MHRHRCLIGCTASPQSQQRVRQQGAFMTRGEPPAHWRAAGPTQAVGLLPYLRGPKQKTDRQTDRQDAHRSDHHQLPPPSNCNCNPDPLTAHAEQERRSCAPLASCLPCHCGTLSATQQVLPHEKHTTAHLQASCAQALTALATAKPREVVTVAEKAGSGAPAARHCRAQAPWPWTRG